MFSESLGLIDGNFLAFLAFQKQAGEYSAANFRKIAESYYDMGHRKSLKPEGKQEEDGETISKAIEVGL